MGNHILSNAFDKINLVEFFHWSELIKLSFRQKFGKLDSDLAEFFVHFSIFTQADSEFIKHGIWCFHYLENQRKSSALLAVVSLSIAKLDILDSPMKKS